MKGFCLSVFLIFLSINIAIPQNIHICDYKFNEHLGVKDYTDMKPEILSIFNLKEDLIIQIKNKVNGDISFWRVYDIDRQSVDPNNPKIIAKTIRERVHLSRYLYDNINNLSYYDTRRKITIGLLSKLKQRYNHFFD